MSGPATWGNRMLAHMLEPNQRMRRTQFETLNRPEVDIVFLGDSLMEYGLWGEWFPHLTVANRGIGGETTLGVLNRIDSAIGNQKYVCIEVGTNALSVGRLPSEIAQSIATIIARIQAIAPESRIILNSVPPREKAYREPVKALNRRLASLAALASAQDDPASVIYLDLWPALATNEGTLRDDYTIDHLHLTGPGYAAWVECLRPLLV